MRFSRNGFIHENAELEVTEEFVRKRWEIELRAKKARFCFQNRECGKRDLSLALRLFWGRHSIAQVPPEIVQIRLIMTGIWPNYQKLISNNFKNLTVEIASFASLGEINFFGVCKLFSSDVVTDLFIKTLREVYRSSVTLLNTK